MVQIEFTNETCSNVPSLTTTQIFIWKLIKNLPMKRKGLYLPAIRAIIVNTFSIRAFWKIHIHIISEIANLWLHQKKHNHTRNNYLQLITIEINFNGFICATGKIVYSFHLYIWFKKRNTIAHSNHQIINITIKTTHSEFRKVWAKSYASPILKPNEPSS